MPEIVLTISFIIVMICLVAFIGYALYSLFSKTTDVYKDAMGMAEQGKYLEARSLLRSRLKKNARDPLTNYYFAKICDLQGNDEEEMEHLRKLKSIGIFPPPLNSGEIFQKAAQKYYKKNNLPFAFENFLNVLHYEAHDEAALAHISFMAIGQGSFAIAEKYFNRLVQTAPQVAEYRIAYGIALDMQKKSNLAIAEFNQVLQTEPEEQTALFLKALICFQQRRSVDAEEGVSKLLEQEQVDFHIRYITHKLAVAVYYLEEDIKRATEHAETCVQLSKEQHETEVGWEDELYDAYGSLTLLSLAKENFPRVIECILEMDLLKPGSELGRKLSVFRQELEDGKASLSIPSENGFFL